MERVVNEVSCECKWTGDFKSVLKEDEVCCPTMVLFRCPGCKREIVSVNTVNNLPHASIPLSSGAILSLGSLDDKNNDSKKAIPRIEGKDKKRVALGIRVAFLNDVSRG